VAGAVGEAAQVTVTLDSVVVEVVDVEVVVDVVVVVETILTLVVVVVTVDWMYAEQKALAEAV
jgi:hypothetical protein